jgi:hypothetical protein
MTIQDELAMVDLEQTGTALVQAINTADLTEEEADSLRTLHSIICETLRNLRTVANMQ